MLPRLPRKKTFVPVECTTARSTPASTKARLVEDDEEQSVELSGAGNSQRIAEADASIIEQNIVSHIDSYIMQ
eukprot:4000387-Prymnesium_polylepis.1